MIRVVKTNSDIPTEIEQLYEEAFPSNERIDYSHLVDCVKANKADMLSLVKDEQFIGFAFVILPTDYAYICFCAVIPSMRNKGYGTELVRLLREFYVGRQLVVDIEKLDEQAPNYEQRYRRYMFYIRNGFNDTGYVLSDAMGDFWLLSTDGCLNSEHFSESYKIFSHNFINHVIWKKSHKGVKDIVNEIN